MYLLQYIFRVLELPPFFNSSWHLWCGLRQSQVSVKTFQKNSVVCSLNFKVGWWLHFWQTEKVQNKKEEENVTFNKARGDILKGKKMGLWLYCAKSSRALDPNKDGHLEQIRFMSKEKEGRPQRQHCLRRSSPKGLKKRNGQMGLFLLVMWIGKLKVGTQFKIFFGGSFLSWRVE